MPMGRMGLALLRKNLDVPRFVDGQILQCHGHCGGKGCGVCQKFLWVRGSKDRELRVVISGTQCLLEGSSSVDGESVY